MRRDFVGFLVPVLPLAGKCAKMLPVPGLTACRAFKCEKGMTSRSRVRGGSVMLTIRMWIREEMKYEYSGHIDHLRAGRRVAGGGFRHLSREGRAQQGPG